MSKRLLAITAVALCSLAAAPAFATPDRTSGGGEQRPDPGTVSSRLVSPPPPEPRNPPPPETFELPPFGNQGLLDLAAPDFESIVVDPVLKELLPPTDKLT